MRSKCGEYPEYHTSADNLALISPEGLDALKEISILCDEASLETSLRYAEMVEPIISCIDEYRINESYLFNKVIKYIMDDKDIAKIEVRNYLQLAEEYFEQAKRSLDLKNYRLIVDASSNVAGLCAKVFLILANEEIPKRHGGIINRFSNVYIKDGVLPKEIGRRLNTLLRIRNKARYGYHTDILKPVWFLVFLKAKSWLQLYSGYIVLVF
jgi:uncharacterized protein (UPF0332 family)